MPEEVFSLWLDDRIKHCGWPPRGIEWQGFLLGEDLPYWRRLDWTKEAFPLTLDKLGASSIRLAALIYEACVLGRDNIISSYIPDGRERFQRLTRYVLDHGRLPAPLVLLDRSGVVDVVDGNHRTALVLGLQMADGANGCPSIREVEAWIGRAPSSPA